VASVLYNRTNQFVYFESEAKFVHFVREHDKEQSAESAGGDKAEPDRREPDEAGVRGKRRPVVLLGGIVVIALLIGSGFYYWFTTRKRSNQRRCL
jgi:hypothetical protein